MTQIVVSLGLVVSGLFVAVGAGTPAALRPFGWVVAVVGALGVLAGVLLRRRVRDGR